MGIPPKTFLAQLVQDQTIDQATADKYEVDSLQKELQIDEYLLKHTDISKETILKTKAKLLNVAYVDIALVAVDPQALSIVPETLAKRHNIIPYLFDSTNERIFIASADPLDVNLNDFLETKIGKRVTLVLAYGPDITKAINSSYTQNLSPQVKQALNEVVETPTQTATQAVSNEFNEAPIAKIVNTILEFGIKSRASDIHIEPQEMKTRVRYRIDGILQEKLTLPRTIHESLISRIKILAQMKIDEKRSPQDGRFNFKIRSDEIDLRVSSLPTVNGEKIVMRLLKKSGGIPSLNDLGLRGTQQKDLELGITRPYGIILVTGPTGSGKTTTLYSVLSKLNTPNTNILTLEDPVEYQIAGINQVQINAAAGLTFATGLRSFLRQDPNIILVGEIRDKETTQLAIQAALTGHLVFSTLHTNDAATAIPRLVDLGGEPFLLASVLNLSVAQRIVRRICETCKEWIEPPTEIQENIKHSLGDYLPKIYKEGAPIKLAKGKGCDECGRTGYLGRIAVFEVLRITPAITKMILQQTSAKEIEEHAKTEGLITMKQDGYLKALEGFTTLEEIVRVAEN